MALIKYRECGKEISDKALACIHCGFPLSLLEKKTEPEIIKSKSDDIKEKNKNNNVSASSNGYSFELLDYGNKKTQVALALKNTLKMKDADALELVVSTPSRTISYTKKICVLMALLLLKRHLGCARYVVLMA